MLEFDDIRVYDIEVVYTHYICIPQDTSFVCFTFSLHFSIDVVLKLYLSFSLLCFVLHKVSHMSTNTNTNEFSKA